MNRWRIVFCLGGAVYECDYIVESRGGVRMRGNVTKNGDPHIGGTRSYRNCANVVITRL